MVFLVWLTGSLVANMSCKILIVFGYFDLQFWLKYLEQNKTNKIRQGQKKIYVWFSVNFDPYCQSCIIRKETGY